MVKIFKKRAAAKSIHQEYEDLKVPTRLKNITVTRRALIAALIILAGAFTHAKIFNSSATPVSQHNAEKVVSCAYSAFMGRIPDSSGAKYWEARYISKNYDTKDLARGLLYSAEGQREANQTGFSGFVNRSYESCLQRPLKSTEYNALLAHYRAGVKKEDLFAIIIGGGDKGVSFPSYIKCGGFLKGGSVIPLCAPGSNGGVNDVAVTNLSGTNIIVNRALANNFINFRNSALTYRSSTVTNGYNLQAYTDPSLASRKVKECVNGANLLKSPGSYRTAADQACLTKMGYPTASGTSMHQWGLAVDLTCNGKPLASSGSCLTWVRNNAAQFGLYNKVANEAWHYSTTGN